MNETLISRREWSWVVFQFKLVLQVAGFSDQTIIELYTKITNLMDHFDRNGGLSRRRGSLSHKLRRSSLLRGRRDGLSLSVDFHWNGVLSPRRTLRRGFSNTSIFSPFVTSTDFFLASWWRRPFLLMMVVLSLLCCWLLVRRVLVDDFDRDEVAALERVFVRFHHRRAGWRRRVVMSRRLLLVVERRRRTAERRLSAERWRVTTTKSFRIGL